MMPGTDSVKINITRMPPISPTIGTASKASGSLGAAMLMMPAAPQKIRRTMSDPSIPSTPKMR